MAWASFLSSSQIIMPFGLHFRLCGLTVLRPVQAFCMFLVLGLFLDSYDLFVLLFSSCFRFEDIGHVLVYVMRVAYEAGVQTSRGKAGRMEVCVGVWFYVHGFFLPVSLFVLFKLAPPRR